MKTQQLPIDPYWRDAINKLAKIDLDDDDVRIYSSEASVSWMSCACGKLDEHIPRFYRLLGESLNELYYRNKEDADRMENELQALGVKGVVINHGTPKDAILIQLGLEFGDLWERAAEVYPYRVDDIAGKLHKCLDIIEQRANDIYMEQIRKEDSNG